MKVSLLFLHAVTGRATTSTLSSTCQGCHYFKNHPECLNIEVEFNDFSSFPAYTVRAGKSFINTVFERETSDKLNEMQYTINKKTVGRIILLKAIFFLDFIYKYINAKFQIVIC